MFNFIKKFFKKPSQNNPAPVISNGRETLSHSEGVQMRAAIIVGHTQEAQGATMFGGTITEYKYNSELATKILEMAQPYKNIKPIIIYRDGIGIEGAYEKAQEMGCDVAIELHFNAADGNVTGSETLCAPVQEDLDFASHIHYHICRVMGRTDKSRGVKAIPISARGGKNVHSFTNGPNCLIEPFFGDSKEDSHVGIANRAVLASAIAAALEQYASKKLILG